MKKSTLLWIVCAAAIVALLTATVLRARADLRREMAEREALFSRNAKVQAEAELKNAAVQQQAVSSFSEAKYRSSLDAIDSLIKQRQWAAAKQNLDATFRDVQRVVNSPRGTERAVVAVSERLNRQERAILAALHEQKDREDEANSIPAVALFRAFEENEIRANQTFKNKPVRVRGLVESISTDILGTPFVALTGSSVFSVQAMFPKGSEGRLAGLTKGQTVIVNCRCDGKLLNVILRDCSIE